MEEYLYVGISPRGWVLRREDEIIKDARSSMINPVYYAQLPLTKSKRWQTKYTPYTFSPSGNRLVAYLKPILLNGYPIVEIESEAKVLHSYAYTLDKVKRIAAEGPLEGYNAAYTVDTEKPFTYVFIKDLPKYVPHRKDDGTWMLLPLYFLDDIFKYLSDNFKEQDT